MTTARSYQVAVEVVSPPSPTARTAQCIAEVVSSTGTSAAPLAGNPAIVQTYVAETASVPVAPRARAAQVVAEVLSRSGLGANPLLDGTPASIQTFTAEVLRAPVSAAQSSQLAAEVLSRSGLGANPLHNNPAVVQTFALEIVSFGLPPDSAPGQPDVPDDGVPGHVCHCVITPEPPPVKYLMRRRSTS